MSKNRLMKLLYGTKCFEHSYPNIGLNISSLMSLHPNLNACNNLTTSIQRPSVVAFSDFSVLFHSSCSGNIIPCSVTLGFASDTCFII